VKSGSQLSDREWEDAAKLFSFRAGTSGQDIAHFLGRDRKTGQKLNRVFRGMVAPLAPSHIPGVSEWDESIFSKQWVLGGFSRDSKQCLLQCIPDRREDTLCPRVMRAAGAEGLIFTDEWSGYNDLYRHMTVCHSREFVNNQMRFVHTNGIEGIWGHAKTLSWHTYRGFPRASLPQFLSEVMFRYNLHTYEARQSVLSALLTRRFINTLRV
jgi:ISXO2-like transposase domain